MDVTLFELHVSDAEFNAPFAGRSTENESPDESVPATATDGQSSNLGPVAALIALAGLALLARYLRGGQAEQATLDELEVE